ncbi:Apyrase [Oesophagostomum dentatum]|uniref:Apyrase n=1 Tax=Oesophagostomum dentatum TaxID=61180 RepID=A0A0B1S2Q4_OESDE|nr:Apyrase [Oesophagostomum dentatum]
MVMPRRPEPRASAIDLAMVAIGSIVATFVFMRFFGDKALTVVDVELESAYNRTQLYQARNLKDGAVEYDLLVVTDLDHDSKVSNKKWQSIARRGTLKLSPDQKTVSVTWKADSTFPLTTEIASGGRAMELSDLCVFDGRLLAADDRTGLIYEIKDDKAYPWVFLVDGPGNATKGLKAEWLTVKGDELYVGGLGKEWTTTDGVYVNDNPMWIKVLSRNGKVSFTFFIVFFNSEGVAFLLKQYFFVISYDYRLWNFFFCYFPVG